MLEDFKNSNPNYTTDEISNLENQLLIDFKEREKSYLENQKKLDQDIEKSYLESELLK